MTHTITLIPGDGIGPEVTGAERHGATLVAALNRVLAEDKVRTRDLGGTASTTDFTEAICRRLV